MNFIKRIKNMHGNTKIVALNTFYAFLIKGAAFVISFFSTPAFIKYFNNNEILGLWFTLLSVLMWFLTFDLGIGNGIRNHLVKALTRNDREDARSILSSGIAWSALIATVLAAIGFLLISSIDLNKILNVKSDVISPYILRKTVLFVFVAVILRFFLTTINSIFYALQKSSINNLLSLIISILIFVYVLIFRFDNVSDSLINLAIAYIIVSTVPPIIAGIIIFSTELRDCIPSFSYIKKNATKKVLGVGFIFFFCQISYLIISGTNEFLITYFWNPLYTADYSFYNRVTMLISTIVSLALSPTWSMVTKAHQEGNIAWVQKLYRMFKLTGVIVIILQFALVPFLQLIMNIWLGVGQLSVKTSYAIVFAIFGSAMLYSTMLSTIVCGLSQMRLQTICFGVGAIFKIILVIVIAHFCLDWIGVVIINTIILGVYCILEQYRLNTILSTNKRICN